MHFLLLYVLCQYVYTYTFWHVTAINPRMGKVHKFMMVMILGERGLSI